MNGIGSSGAQNPSKRVKRKNRPDKNPGGSSKHGKLWVALYLVRGVSQPRSWAMPLVDATDYWCLVHICGTQVVRATVTLASKSTPSSELMQVALEVQTNTSETFPSNSHCITTPRRRTNHTPQYTIFKHPGELELLSGWSLFLVACALQSHRLYDKQANPTREDW